MANGRELADAFAAALRQTDQALAAELRTRDGASARPELEQLRADLLAQRDAAIARGGADAAWLREVIRRVAAWTPETELALLGALGQIARAGSGAARR